MRLKTSTAIWKAEPRDHGSHQGDEYDEALSTLAELEDIGWKVRLCLMDTQRALNFLVRKARLPGGQLEQAREILRDIESLLPHNESLFQKVNFLMQAAMGFINIEQNRIIKIEHRNRSKVVDELKGRHTTDIAGHGQVQQNVDGDRRRL